MFHNKIRYLLAASGLHMSDYASLLGRTRQSISVKFKNDAFSPADLIRFAEMTGTRLAFVDREGRVVVEFDRHDLPEEKL